MALYDYIIIQGTTGALTTFQNAVNAQVALGYTLAGGVAQDGSNLSQAMALFIPDMVPTYAIAAVVIGTSGTFAIAGDHAIEFKPGTRFTIRGSTGNDGVWTTTEAGSTYSAPNTVIPVEEEITDSTVDGEIILYTVGN